MYAFCELRFLALALVLILEAGLLLCFKGELLFYFSFEFLADGFLADGFLPTPAPAPAPVLFNETVILEAGVGVTFLDTVSRRRVCDFL